MKKLFAILVAAAAMIGCSGEREYLDVHGLSMGMPAKAFCDSLVARGYEVDTNLTDASVYVLIEPKGRALRYDILQHNDTIDEVLESYTATYNDSTSQLWQKMHDDFQDEFGMPGMLHRADLHKEAIYNTGKGGLRLILLNTYSPTMTVRYTTSLDEK